MASKLKTLINLLFIVGFLYLSVKLIIAGNAVMGGTLLAVVGIWMTAAYILGIKPEKNKAPEET